MGRLCGVHDLHTVSHEVNTTGPTGDGGIFLLDKAGWVDIGY